MTRGTTLRNLGPRGIAFYAVVLLGIASVMLPELASSAGTMWGGAAIAWAVLFAVVGLLSARGGVSETVEPEVEARAG